MMADPSLWGDPAGPVEEDVKTERGGHAAGERRPLKGDISRINVYGPMGPLDNRGRHDWSDRAQRLGGSGGCPVSWTGLRNVGIGRAARPPGPAAPVVA